MVLKGLEQYIVTAGSTEDAEVLTCKAPDGPTFIARLTCRACGAEEDVSGALDEYEARIRAADSAHACRSAT